jgi:pyroglutamyl-peptidase
MEGMRILITGFEPFLSHAANPTALLADRLDGALAAGARLHGVRLPVAFDRAAAAFETAFRTIRPDAVLLFGLAYSYDEVRPERLALNLDDSTSPDNDGTIRINRPIDPAGPMGYWSSLPVDAIVARLGAEGLPAKPSRDAGGYVCNHLFFRVRHWLTGQGLGALPAGFIHVPPTPDLITEADQGRRLGWSMDRIDHAARLAAAVVAERGTGVPDGALDG